MNKKQEIQDNQIKYIWEIYKPAFWIKKYKNIYANKRVV